MDTIFGLPMTGVLIGALALMALCLGATALVAVRNRLVFRLALRNVPRRRTQSILVMTGLMLSTAITTAALVTGDTLDRSLTASTRQSLGQVDEIIAPADGSDRRAGLELAGQTFPAAVAGELEARLEADGPVAGVMPVLTIAAPVVNPATGLSEPVAVVTGLDPARVGAFGGLRTSGGREVDFAGLPEGSTVISSELAEAIGANAGDEVTFYAGGDARTLTVAAIVPGSILTGYAPTEREAGPASAPSGDLLGMAVPLAWLQDVTGMAGEARFIAVTNRDGLDGTDAAVAALDDALAGIDGAPAGWA